MISAVNYSKLLCSYWRISERRTAERSRNNSNSLITSKHLSLCSRRVYVNLHIICRSVLRVVRSSVVIFCSLCAYFGSII